jgi:hypothetical protein
LLDINAKKCTALATVPAVLLLSLALAACGGSGTSSGSPSATNAASSGASASSGAGTSGSPSASGSSAGKSSSGTSATSGFIPATAAEREQSRLKQKQQQDRVRKALEVAASVKGASLPSGVLARVDGTPVTEAAYNQAIRATATASLQPLVTNPSDYSACISVLKARTELAVKVARERHQVGEGAPAKSEAELKEECEQHYKQLQASALSGLITRLQTQLQAKEVGASLNQTELGKQVASTEQRLRTIAKDPAATASAYSETPEYTEAAVRELLGEQLLQDAIVEKVNAKFTRHVSKGQVEQYFDRHKQLYAAKNTSAHLTPVIQRTIEQSLSVSGEGQGQEKYNERAKAKLKAETECATGHVVAVCSEYTPPDFPALDRGGPVKR